MPKINSLEELRVKIERSRLTFAAELIVALNTAVVKVQADAKNKFGSYQAAVGPFPEWEDLNYDYVKRKLKAGSPGDDPLIGHYSGSGGNKLYPTALRNSILSEIRGFKGYVGTNDPIGKWQEFGTSTIPPRPFLRPALYENREFIKGLFAAAMVKALKG